MHVISSSTLTSTTPFVAESLFKAVSVIAVLVVVNGGGDGGRNQLSSLDIKYRQQRHDSELSSVFVKDMDRLTFVWHLY